MKEPTFTQLLTSGGEFLVVDSVLDGLVLEEQSCDPIPVSDLTRGISQFVKRPTVRFHCTEQLTITNDDANFFKQLFGHFVRLQKKPDRSQAIKITEEVMCRYFNMGVL